jgi:hypothetical protein
MCLVEDLFSGTCKRAEPLTCVKWGTDLDGLLPKYAHAVKKYCSYYCPSIDNAGDAGVGTGKDFLYCARNVKIAAIDFNHPMLGRARIGRSR